MPKGSTVLVCTWSESFDISRLGYCDLLAKDLRGFIQMMTINTVQ